jgi:hypothetical protein
MFVRPFLRLCDNDILTSFGVSVPAFILARLLRSAADLEECAFDALTGRVRTELGGQGACDAA